MLNKKILIFTLGLFCFFAIEAKSGPVINYQATDYSKLLYIYTSNANVSGSRRISLRYGIDVMGPDGNTAVCHAINNNDPKTYKMLISMGAKSQNYCMKKANIITRTRFTKSLNEYEATTAGAYHDGGSLLTKAKYARPEETMSIASKVGIGAGVVAVIGGVAAAAGGGGGGGSSSGSDNEKPEPEIPCEERGGTIVNGECIIFGQPGAAPKDADPKDYQTKEFNKGGNFLSLINADNAYARGYTGYIVNRNTDGILPDDGSDLITDNKVKVAILDNAFDVNHPDLVENIVKDKDGKTYGYNLNYGPCRNGDTTNCYGYDYDEDAKMGSLVLYDESGNIVGGTSYQYTQADYDEWFNEYPDDYDWDKLKYNPIPYLPDNGVNSTLNTQDNDHGTHVMGILGAAANGMGMQGVAPNVEMVGISYTQSIAFPEIDNVYQKALDVILAENTKVINMSFGVETTSDKRTQASYFLGKDAENSHISGFEYMLPLFEGLADNNIVVVKAAGNEGNKYEADALSGIPLSNNFKQGSEHDFTNLFITVVSVNGNGELASYSQKCGATKDYCIAAPGGDSKLGELIYSTVQNDSNHKKDENGNAYGYMQGTSMATPVVTGSVALLMGAYPHLTPQQIVEIIFKTATDLGETGVDEQFGYGLLNLEAATNPVGYLEFGFSNQDTSDQVSQSVLTLSKSTQAKLLAALPAKFTAFDEYNRGFEVKTSSLFADTTKQKRHLFENDFKAFLSSGKQKIDASDRLSFAFNSSVTGNDIRSPYGFLEIEYKADNKSNFYAFYSENTILNNGTTLVRTEQNPFISMDNAFGAGITRKLGKTEIKFDYTNGKNNFFDDEDNSDLYDNRMDVFSTELTYNLNNNLGISSVAGMLKEDGSVLGMIGTNTFDFNNSETYFGGVKILYKPINKLSLSGSYYRGYTDTSTNSSVFNLSNIESESIALNATYLLSSNSNIGLDIYSPLRIVKGTADIYLASGRHPTEDKLYVQKYSASIKDDAQEWDLSMFYNTKLKNDTNLKTRFGIRLNPEHDANARPDYFGMFNLNFAF